MPIGGDCEYPDFDACVRANSDREDPNAYCAVIQRETEEKCRKMAENRTVVGVLSANGNPTGDKRVIGRDSLRWSLPLPLRRQREDFGAHNGAVVVGSIDDIKQAPSGELMFRGKLFDTPDGQAAYDEMYSRYASSGLKYGVSVDLDDVIAYADDDTDPEMMELESGRLRGATLCDIPAYASAYAMLECQIEARTLVAAGSPRADLHSQVFADPKLGSPTPLTVTEDGRIYGHAALWSSCHTAYDVCVRPPKNFTGYAYFNTGAVATTDGKLVPVGHITMGVGHANPRLNAQAAAEHYDNVNTIVADIRVGDDEHGIWFAGALRDGVTPEQARELQAASVSGDWRSINGNLEMVALLSVVSPGFPIPRVKALVAGGQVQSLVASATFDSEANVENGDDMVSEGAPVDPVAEEVAEVEAAAEPSVDVPEVSPEVVAEAMAEESPAEEEVEEGEGDDSVIDIKDEVAALRQEISELRALLAPPAPAEDEMAAEGDPVEPVPAIERDPSELQSVLENLDKLVKPSVSEILAGLDARVG